MFSVIPLRLAVCMNSLLQPCCNYSYIKPGILSKWSFCFNFRKYILFQGWNITPSILSLVNKQVSVVINHVFHHDCNKSNLLWILRIPSSSMYLIQAFLGILFRYYRQIFHQASGIPFWKRCNLDSVTTFYQNSAKFLVSVASSNLYIHAILPCHSMNQKSHDGLACCWNSH